MNVLPPSTASGARVLLEITSRVFPSGSTTLMRCTESSPNRGFCTKPANTSRTSTGTVKRQYILRIRTSRSMACIGMPPSGASLSAYQCPGVRVRQPERFRHGGIDHLPLDHVQAQEQRCVVAARLFPAVARQPLRVGERSIGERQGGGAWQAARHVRDGVMDDPVHDIGGMVVRRRYAGLDAVVLFHGHVDYHSAGLHELM